MKLKRNVRETENVEWNKSKDIAQREKRIIQRHEQRRTVKLRKIKNFSFFLNNYYCVVLCCIVACTFCFCIILRISFCYFQLRNIWISRLFPRKVRYFCVPFVNCLCVCACLFMLGRFLIANGRSCFCRTFFYLRRKISFVHIFMNVCACWNEAYIYFNTNKMEHTQLQMWFLSTPFPIVTSFPSKKARLSFSFCLLVYVRWRFKFANNNPDCFHNGKRKGHGRYEHRCWTLMLPCYTHALMYTMTKK